MKYFHLIALVGFVAVASAADLSAGVGGGRVIFEQNATASPAIWRQTKNLTVSTPGDEVISQVVVIDNRPEKDGEAKVVEGGEGHKNVTIELQSPAVFRGYDFSITVLAVPADANAPAPKHPKTTGVETQNPQVPYSKDLNVNNQQGPQNGDDIILGAPTPTATSTTEGHKDDQHKLNNPALVGKEQTRLNRDTEDQKTKDQTPAPAPADVPSGVDAKDIKANETTTEESDDNLEVVLDSIFGNNSSHKTEESPKDQASPVVPKNNDKDLIHLDDDEENRKVRQVLKEPIIPVLPKELNGEVPTTPKGELSSTTRKSVGQDKAVPRLVPVTSEASSTLLADKVTTELPEISSKLPENVKTTQDLERNLKGHHFGHRHTVPLPYVN